jgi:uncharacterized repeat protein (TIGR03803 family)
MQSNHRNRSRAFWARGFAALWAALIVAAAGGGASAAPVEIVLHSFMASPSDGAFPEAGLIADSSGNHYGTTYLGGGTGSICSNGCGTVFKLTPGGTETVLYSFTGRSDGSGPVGGLIADSSGLYGTTPEGGASGCFAGCGVVFKVSPSGTETVFHIFRGAPPATGHYPKPA